MQKRYPLQAARTVRQNDLEQAEQALAHRRRELAEATAGVERAEQAVETHRRESASVRAREAEKDAAGRTAAEMLRVQAFLRRLGDEEDALEARVDDARQVEAAAARAVREAREALAEAQASAKAVERHHEGWQASERGRQEARAEAEAEDAAVARWMRDRRDR